MIIDIIVIFKFYLIFNSIDNGGPPSGVSVFGTHVRIRTPCVIIRTPYIPLNKLYIIDESIRKITITLFKINFIKNIL